MTSSGKRKQAAGFLERFKRKVERAGLDFADRKKNLDSLARLGLDLTDAEEMVLDLAAEDYVSGPEADESGSEGEVWVFGTFREGAEVYVKLKLDRIRGRCISFHEAEHRLRFPFREEG